MDKKKVLVLGSTGMLGHIVYLYLKNNDYIIQNISFRNKLNNDSIILNVKNKLELENILMDSHPDYIVNCIGILIKGSEDIENAVYINAYLPHYLKNMAERINAKLIHISTDCVFSGKDGPYSEFSFRDADDIYGRSKALGEINDPKHLTIRTSIIGPELKNNGEGLFHWFMTQEGEIEGYKNAIWGGVTTLELAKAIDNCIKDENISGLVHLTNGTMISKYQLLKLIQLEWKIKNIKINESVARKNVNKSLIKSETYNYEVPSYKTMIFELHKWMIEHTDIYPQYKQ